MSSFLAVPFYVLMLFTYNTSGHNTSTSYMVKDQTLCILGAQSWNNSKSGLYGLCIPVDTVERASHVCNLSSIEKPCASKLPDDLVLGPYDNVLYRVK